MATATTDEKKNGSAPKAEKDSAAASSAPAAKAAIPYLVFESPTPELVPGATVKFLGRFTAENKTDARWAAVDADPTLAERVSVPAGSTEGGAFLISVSERMAQVERTVEEVVETKVRR